MKHLHHFKTPSGRLSPTRTFTSHLMRRAGLPLALFVLQAALLTASAIDGTFSVSETYSVTLTYHNWGEQNYSGTQTFTGTKSGSLVLSGSAFTLIDQSGVPHTPPAGASRARTLNSSGGSFSITGDKVMPYILAGPTLIGIIYLSEFVISVPVVDGEIPVFYNYTSYYTSGTSLSSLSASGSLTGSDLTVTASSTSSFTPSAAPPSITVGPVSQTVGPGATVLFTVGVIGSAPLSYQWQKDGTNLSGATASSYSITNAQPQHAGNYVARVSNAYGTTYSPPATLTVLTRPVIIAQPQSLSVTVGATAQFAVMATGALPLRYQWMRNGSDLPSATNANFSITNAQLADTGVYSVVVNNSYGSTNSLGANLTVTLPVTLANALDGSNLVWTTSGTLPWFAQTTDSHDGADAARSGTISHSQQSVLQTTVTGPGTLSFWWRVSSESGYDFLRFYVAGVQQSQISGESGWVQQTYSVPAGTQTLQWIYSKDTSVSAGQDAGWLDQVNFMSTGSPPSITAQPQSITVTSNDQIPILSAAAAGTTPLACQWFFNAQPLPGATNFTLTLTNVGADNAGNYQARCFNALGAATSQVATLTINVPIRLLALPAESGSGFQCQIESARRQPLEILVSADLTSWATNATLTNQAGVMRLTDATTTNSPARFYRAKRTAITP